MIDTPDISVVITTFNRRELVIGAVRSVLAQTRTVGQLIIVDDGSNDGTEAALAREFSGRIEYVWQENRGVSSARNRGLALARGRYLCLLDSDDRWHPDKSRLQMDWLEDRPDYGMVLCDVIRVDAQEHQIDILPRRAAIPEDGEVLQWVMRDPALVPSSIMLRREVVESIGGFDTNLATAEDLDFHLRVARSWKIGVIEQPLATARRGHDGLSASLGTYSDYVQVFERFATTVSERLTVAQIGTALSSAYRRSARGLVLEGRWQEAFRYASQALTHAPTLGEKLRTLGLAPPAARRCLSALKRSWKSRPA